MRQLKDICRPPPRREPPADSPASARRRLVAWLAAAFALILLLPESSRAEGEGRQARAREGWNPPATTGPFSVPGALRPAVDFWIKIFTRYTSDDAVIHHAHDLSIVYDTIDLRDLRGQPRAREARVESAVRRIQRRHPELDSEDIHVQYGIRERFERGLIVSHRYLPEIERIFREEGLPPQLTRLPFVESSFNVNAVSKVGASGIWQFMPSTGRLYMRVGGAVDERNDPIVSSRGAARLLKYNYESTGSWPLALTAYNHGLGGVTRAVRVTGSRNIVDIIRHYREANFGFASRNFYAEFLAALEVDRDYVRHFGNLQFDRPFAHDEIRLERSLTARQLIRAGIDRDELERFNPGLTEAALSSNVAIPAGHSIRVPIGHGNRVVANLRGVSPVEVRRVARRSVERHRVRRGETLSSIARQYGVSRNALARANGVSTRGRMKRGRVLRVPRVVMVARTVETSYQGGDNAVMVRRSNPPPIERGEARVADSDWESDAFISSRPEPPPQRIAKATDGRPEAGNVDATGMMIASGSNERKSPEAAPRVEYLKTRSEEPPPAVAADPPPKIAPVPAPKSRGTFRGPLVITPLPGQKLPASAPPPPVPPPLLSSAGAVKPGASSSAGVSGSVHAKAKPLSSPGAVIASASAGEFSSVSRRTPRPRTRTLTHVVKRNETLWDIAQRYEISVSSVKRANAGKKLSPLKPGMRLLIPVGTRRT